MESHLRKPCMPDQCIQTDVPKKTKKILSIDGGGIRGVVPIRILAAIEKKLDKPITNYFDIMGGTSAGGILVLLLNIPSLKGGPEYSAQDVYEIYREFGKSIFHRTPYQSIRTMNGWWGDKYTDKNLMTILERFMGNYTLLDTVKDVIIPSYDLMEDKNYIFRKKRAFEHEDRNFYLQDIARATSAAPTYFKPAELSSVDGKHSHIMVDGGVSVNNPALASLVYGFSQFNTNVEYFVVSIGTGTTHGSHKSKFAEQNMNIKNVGKLGWASQIVPLLMDSVNDVIDYEMQEILPHTHYHRLQVIIEPEFSQMDDIREESIKSLESYADKFIQENEGLLDKIVERLLDG